MLYSTLDNLPRPASNSAKWPWFQSDSQLSEAVLGPTSWPRVTVVTPSYNQGEFIEETIRSVLLQSYPNLEYIIIDGGSTDNSVDIISRYRSWLMYWVSEKDEGQSDAINKGWGMATGKYITWLNSDDVLMPAALFRAVSLLEKHPGASFIYGDPILIDESGRELERRRVHRQKVKSSKMSAIPYNVPQPTTLIRREALTDVGLLDKNLHYAMDYDLFLRLERWGDVFYLPSFQAQMRLYMGTKTSMNVVQNQWEKLSVLRRYRRNWLFSKNALRLLRLLLWSRLPKSMQRKSRQLRSNARDKVFLAHSDQIDG